MKQGSQQTALLKPVKGTSKMFDVKIQALLGSTTDLANLAKGIYKGHDDDLAIHLIHIGLERYKAKQRGIIKRRIKDTILSPEAVEKSTKTSAKGFDYNPKPSMKTQRKSVENAVKAVQGILKTWSIGNVLLGDATKEILLHEAKNERSRGKGHVENAIFYERLALPMDDTEKVKENKHWKSDEAVMLIRAEILQQASTSSLGFVGKGELHPRV